MAGALKDRNLLLLVLSKLYPFSQAVKFVKNHSVTIY